ncbi:enolase C-terminal domain-like protein [Streptomyces sp. GS7]|uniref:enolase C-terminal domain-like protein n=1 Tax=Streptomyces sp. GS7 TaxID=2692234 RepID=UPI001315FF54|nr:enolase C-terminal domain-like protein [Streptomyces sp. GS7]QHC21139.1 glucarate dehydratase [Streptomyces sp. GS7]
MAAAPEDLTVAEVRLTPVLVADPPLLNIQGVHQPYTPRLIIEVVTAGGATGLGETYGDTEYLGPARLLADALVGRRVTDLNGLPALADRVCGDSPDATDAGTVHAVATSGTVATVDDAATVDAAGLRGARTAGKLRRSVLAGFEVACLDAWGRAAGLPVHALLGGRVRDRVEYSAYLFYRWAAHPGDRGEPDDWGAALDPAGIVAQARRFADRHGFTSFKLKGGVFPPDREIAAIRALAAAFPGRPLRLDPNGAWTVETSLRVADALQDVLEYLEDPASGTDRMARVAARTPVPLATNMCVTAFEEIPEAFARGAVQVVLSDHHYWGGLRSTRELAALCRTFGVGLSMHSNTHLGISLAAMTQVAATVPNLDFACDTHYPWQAEDVLTERLAFRDGHLDVGDAPGLGVTLDRDRLAALHRRWLADDGTHRSRDDAAAMRRADPGWTAPAVPRW